MSLTIGALPTRALRDLAAALLPTYTEVELDRLVRRVSTDSAGLALLAVEILRAVSRGLELDGGGKAWPATAQTLEQTLPGDLPDAVVAALRINARRLSKTATPVLARRVAGSRSCFGRHCWPTPPSSNHGWWTRRSTNWNGSAGWWRKDGATASWRALSAACLPRTCSRRVNADGFSHASRNGPAQRTDGTEGRAARFR